MAKALALIILDGWGVAPAASDNAISTARTPTWDALLAKHPHTTLACHGKSVGLPPEQMGNSEVGHLTLGAGRVVKQDLTLIDHALVSGEFYSNQTLLDAIAHAKQAQSALHLVGLLSPGGIHSHQDHLFAILKLCAERSFSNVYVHAILDGRDVGPYSGMQYLDALQDQFKTLGVGQLGSVMGRYYAMDRDTRWERTQAAFDCLVHKKPVHVTTDIQALLEKAYQNDSNDYFIEPTLIAESLENAHAIEDSDACVLFNFRADRMRQLTQALIAEPFNAFEREHTPSFVATFTSYDEKFHAPVCFAKPVIEQSLGEVIATNNLAQLRLAETEKYAHVTYFFNGGSETQFLHEDRVMVPSPRVKHYAEQPAMSAVEVTDVFVEHAKKEAYTLFVCNYANADLVGHSGDFDATVAAIETLDKCLARIVDVCRTHHIDLLITADHGNAEDMHNDDTGHMNTSHTNNSVPLVYVGDTTLTLMPGSLADVAPTVLGCLNIDVPPLMTGHNLAAHD